MRAISSMATRQLLVELLEAAVDAGFPATQVESVGGVDAEQLVASGERVDLVFLSEGALRRLADAGHVDAATVTPLVLSQVAIAMASGSPGPAGRPDGTAFADAAGVQAALRTAGRIGYSTGPSGTALVRMIEEWGLTEELGERLVQARPGIPVAASLATGDVDLGFQQLSELAGHPGVRILGVLPGDCAIDTVFAGAVAIASDDPAHAEELLSFLASDAVVPLKTAHGFRAL